MQHYGAKCYKCTICDETFKSKKEMEAHIKGHANDIPDDENADEMSNQMLHHQQSQQEVKPSILLNTPTASSASTTPSPNGIVLNHQIVTKYETNENSNQLISFAEQFSMLNGAQPAPSTTITTVYPETPKDSEASSEQNSDGDDVTYMNMYTRFEQSVANSYGTNNPALLAVASSATLQPITPTSSSNNGNICNNSNNLITLKPIQQSPPSASQMIYESNQINLNRSNGYFGGSSSGSQQASNDYK